MRRRRCRLLRASFNSRLREEATYSKSREWSHEQVSTHASVRRRPPSPSTHAPFFCFNSRLREEATPITCPSDRESRFNSRLREEATPRNPPPSCPRVSFNSRLREEATDRP